VSDLLLPVVTKIAKEERGWLDLVFASDGGTRNEHEAYVVDRQLQAFAYVVSQELGVAFQVGKLPYAALLDESGVLVAKGLVNSREHLESLFEAKRLGVASLNEYMNAKVRNEAEVDA
jgi:methylamine dehydrogenase accessory protein MauD